MTDIQALRAHLVAEVEQAKREAARCQRSAWAWSRERSHDGPLYAAEAAEIARTATDTWMAADTRLRTLDALIASSQRIVDAIETRHARGRTADETLRDVLAMVQEAT